ncbi:hypothetical protein MLD38_022431 [Melastoma candidum]|uniref:Uncharacterized protein n=1 Tax=Melastoma candidum TaxID=119954 RepID=A0ACB9QJE6_9MYRT|nr:hypothetical protein MLD38_022431 [Melastoma candidum]
MISFHATPDRSDMVVGSSRKRRWVPDEGEAVEWRRGSDGVGIDLQLETPLPVEWQRCLDIQSGEVHFYNIRTHKRTCNDPGRGAATASDPQTTSSAFSHPISLDLELNLQPYVDHRSLPEPETPYTVLQFPVEDGPKRPRPEKKHEKGVDEEEEMVATVCERCHMLVIMCVSRPVCPNCKFIHPTKPDHTPFTLLLKPPKCTAHPLC